METCPTKNSKYRGLKMHIIDLKKLDILVEQRLLSKKKHPLYNLWIYNYTPKQVYEGNWTFETLMCRGLIVDDTGLIIGRPFSKFFNLEEIKNPLPIENFEVTEKMDGSLIIVTMYGKELIISSRGSFDSDHAKKAKQLVLKNYPKGSFKQGFTYLFELISPEFRVVIDYGKLEALYLITIIETATGKEIQYDKILQNKIYNPIVQRFPQKKDIWKLSELNLKNKEGFVIRFTGPSNLRVKVKFEEYKRLHKLITRTSIKDIWLMLRYKQNLDEVLDRIPDEFYNWVKEKIEILQTKFSDLKTNVLKDYEECVNKLKLDGIDIKSWDIITRNEQSSEIKRIRKEIALLFKTKKNPSILFSILDNRDIDDSIWKSIEPKHFLPEENYYKYIKEEYDDLPKGPIVC